MQYIKQLDSVRAIAAILVICWHWVPTTHLINTFNNGAIGVDTFFVLSGFLITRILLKSREAADATGAGRWRIFKNFYARRALRIFPIYYLSILLFYFFHSAVGAQFPRAELVNSLTYTINFYFAAVKEWGHLTVHFWSLAVEEQFYLFWPFLIIMLRRQYILPLMALLIMSSVVFQCLITDPEFGYILTYTCLDAFGLGAVLAWVTLYRPQQLPAIYKVLCWVAAACAGLLVVQVFTGDWAYVPQRTLHAVIALWVITYILLKGGKLNKVSAFILENRVLLFLGKISYGLYLYHVPVQWIRGLYLQLFDRHFGIEPFLRQHAYIILLFDFLLLVGISWLSWCIIEKPILRLKGYFENEPPQKSITLATAMQAP